MRRRLMALYLHFQLPRESYIKACYSMGTLKGRSERDRFYWQGKGYEVIEIGRPENTPPVDPPGQTHMVSQLLQGTRPNGYL